MKMKIFNFLSKIATTSKNLITKISTLFDDENIPYLELLFEKLNIKALFSLRIE